ncbi:serine/threonine protein kinase [Corallococcus praedator]|uniref:Serine/threonine protein kinase n=1 Tax=Corallococcus praedator TaxID=2316724 RepID=A0ABX9QJE0_9BACT|nr:MULTISPECIES: serine/threonine-protein kinase [Corallococcus]RKH32299.1 serine/threonine protein kinase [Corallococcus sp. CA031C]RKI08549.1 serine/threonine protein kinase [Corallococcus praedator]
MQLGKYQLVRKLASGGMAEVFLAKAAGPRGFEKTLVLKRILPHLAEDEAFVEMFLGEAKLAAQLDHPNVVQIFDFGEADGSYFLAMEYIDGPTLRRLIKRSTEQKVPLPVALCAKMVASAAEGLAFAHELTDPETGAPLGLVHRDISPENVLLSRQGAVKVVDFGIAKVAGQSHRTQTGVVKGKVAYMPPEQLQARNMDARVDVYALGMVLYELLTGRRPFEAATEVGMMQAILFEPFVPAVERRPDLPPAMQRILERALAKDREERYPDCRELQADLERFVLSLGEPVGAFQIARLVAQVTENASVPPTPARVDAKARETAVLGAEEPGKVKPRQMEEAPRAAEALTTPMPVREGTAWAGKDAVRARNSASAPEDLLGAPDAATDPATPSAGNVLARGSSPARPLAAPPASVPAEAAVPASPVGKAASRRGVLVASVVALGALVSVGGWVVLGSDSKPVTPGVKGDAALKDPTPTDGVPKAPSVPSVALVAVTDAGSEDAGVPETDAGAPANEAGSTDAVAEVAPMTPDAGSVRKPMKPRPPVARGRVEFRIRPYATVFLDGRNLGQTPFGAVETTAGVHQVRVVNGDLKKDVRRTFEVKAGQDNVFKLNLLAE